MKNFWLRLFFLLSVRPILTFNYWIDDTVNITNLQQAWFFPGGGSGNKPYYTLRINGEMFSGERDWLLRWNALQAVKHIVENKRILELGCNMGLLSIFATKYWHCNCTGLDGTDEKLANKGTPDLIKSAKLAQQAFGISIPIYQLDLDLNNYEAVLGFDYDVVFCCSVLYWVNQKERLVSYLSRFKHLIFEGHDSDALEIDRFEKVGFNHYEIIAKTQIGVSHGVKQRTLFHFWK